MVKPGYNPLEYVDEDEDHDDEIERDTDTMTKMGR